MITEKRDISGELRNEELRLDGVGVLHQLENFIKERKERKKESKKVRNERLGPPPPP